MSVAFFVFFFVFELNQVEQRRGGIVANVFEQAEKKTEARTWVIPSQLG